jgi:hypothetical protein
MISAALLDSTVGQSVSDQSKSLRALANPLATAKSPRKLTIHIEFSRSLIIYSVVRFEPPRGLNVLKRS